MAITVYKSTDASAPSVSTAAGSLITLLDACLVNGYGSKSAAGWTKEYSGTNKAIYKNGAGSSGKYLRFHDDQVGYCGGATRLGLGDGATSVDALTGKSLDATTSAVHVHKPDSVATGGAWTVIADAKACIILTKRAPVSTTDFDHGSYSAAFFGDIISFNYTTDVNRFCCAGDQTTTPGSQPFLYSISTTSLGGYPAYMHGYPEGRVDNGALAYLTSFHPGMDAMYYPSAISRGHILFPTYLVHSSILKSGPEVRGRLPGIFFSPYSVSTDMYLKNMDTVTFSSGDLNGKTFEIYRILGAGSGSGRVVYFETSNTWGN